MLDNLPQQAVLPSALMLQGLLSGCWCAGLRRLRSCFPGWAAPVRLASSLHHRDQTRGTELADGLRRRRLDLCGRFELLAFDLPQRHRVCCARAYCWSA